MTQTYLYNGFKNLETDLLAIIIDSDAEYWREEVAQLRTKGFVTLTALSKQLETRFNDRAEGFKRVTDLTTDLHLLCALSDELNLHTEPPETPRIWLRELLMIRCLQGAVNWRQLILHLIPEDDEIDE